MTLSKVLTSNWIYTEGKEVELVTSTKLLGLTIANDLTWNDQVTEITKKASKRLYFLTLLKRAGVPKQDLALFFVSCVRFSIDYAASVFSNGLPQYLKKELVRLEKRAISIITSGKCNSAIEMELTPILEHYYVLYNRLFDNIVSELNHKLKALLPPDHGNSRYNLRSQRFLKCQSFARTEQVILLYMRCRNSPGCSFIPLIFMLYILKYFNMNMLYRIFLILS